MQETADTTFFEALAARAGTRQRENQLSSTFAACFRESPSFRLSMLQDCEIAAPKKGHGRPDLSLRTADPIGGVGAIWIESKVDSVLTLRQIDKYLTGNIDHLVVITRREPDVRPSELDEIGRRHKKKVCALRWQDVHEH